MMRSVCVPFLSGPASTASSFVAVTRLYVQSSFFPRCYVMINLPLGTWRPLAPQRIWRTLCAIPACLASSPTYKMGICVLIPLWPLSETVSQLLASLIPGYCLERESQQISANRNQTDVTIFRQILLIFDISYHSASICEKMDYCHVYLYACVCVHRQLQKR